MQILNQKQIKQKIKRLAIQILEKNYNESEIIFAGINNNGLGFAKQIKREIKKVSDTLITVTQIKLDPANPLSKDIEIGMGAEQLTNKVVIIVDDVANTGRTIFYAFKPFFEIIPKKIEVAVLVDRKHKSFPVLVDYVGLSLATTMKEDIDVRILNVEEQAVFMN
jgi:pyrimidine operon attenuation protein/uracil phosphoribosyltransferase